MSGRGAFGHRRTWPAASPSRCSALGVASIAVRPGRSPRRDRLGLARRHAAALGDAVGRPVVDAREAYDAVPGTSEFYGVFLQQFADVLHRSPPARRGRCSPTTPRRTCIRGREPALRGGRGHRARVRARVAFARARGGVRVVADPLHAAVARDGARRLQGHAGRRGPHADQRRAHPQLRAAPARRRRRGRRRWPGRRRGRSRRGRARSCCSRPRRRRHARVRGMWAARRRRDRPALAAAGAAPVGASRAHVGHEPDRADLDPAVAPRRSTSRAPTRGIGPIRTAGQNLRSSTCRGGTCRRGWGRSFRC